MPASLAIPLAVETARRNPVRIPVRNLVAARSDRIQFAVSLFEPDGTPADLTGEGVFLTLAHDHGHHGHWDYGLGWLTGCERVAFQGQAIVADPSTGQAEIVVPPGLCTRGRYRLELALGDRCGASVLARGILDVLRTASVPVLPQLGIASISDGVLTPYVVPALAEDGATYLAATGRAPFLITGAFPTDGRLGARLATFTIKLLEPACALTTLRWQAERAAPSPAYVLAETPNDFVADGGLLVFQPGDQFKTVRVLVRPLLPVSSDPGPDALSSEFSADFATGGPTPEFRSAFAVRLLPGTGAVFAKSVGLAVLPGAQPPIGDFASDQFGGDVQGGSQT